MDTQKYAQGFIERQRGAYEQVNGSLIDIAESAKRDFVQQLEKKYSNPPLGIWLDNSITIQGRPGGIKSSTSLARKLEEKFSDANEVFWNYVRSDDISQADSIVTQTVRDIVGLEVRLPCGRFVEDFAKLISEAARTRTSLAPETPDATGAKSSGYRGQNIKIRVGVLSGEIQVKTHLTKAWDYYSHDLFYKKEIIDEITHQRLGGRLSTLSTLLSVCEELSDEVIAELLDRFGNKSSLLG
ncbi:hypothetical protein [Candidatus Accumulibacter cognatus]|uniref:Uncharacterized protein n=1 Tax=Candidatus Accumulibacter cognatus TaxID=2954383 RepID=A0A080MHX5_9PROT|nr:hypothetical protein [Candidatus Accumulibacter cognatus]KFB76844.1 MAG: hypothetical protein AW06_002060 [Candidatus Accumulibacter cognatus]